MKIPNTLAIILLFKIRLLAQGDCCIQNKEEGIALYNQGKYSVAILKFEQAQKSCDACDLSAWISKAKTAQATEHKPLDTDGDGIFDKDDHCLNEKGDPRNHGCPLGEGIGNTEAKVVNGVTFIMKKVNGGPFEMGNNKGEDSEKPQHTVNVFDFSIGATEVTVAQFRNFVEDAGYKTESEKRGYSYFVNNNLWDKKQNVCWKHDGQGNPQVNEQAPVVNVTWKDALAYCDWLGRKTGKNYRLPSEAEWEFAAKGGMKSSGFKYSGSNDIGSVGWFVGNSHNNVQTITGKLPNELGLYDMNGNVWEWCGDWYDAAYYQASPITDPRCANNKSGTRVIRGGAFDDKDRKVYSRNKMDPNYGAYNVGFRVVMEE